jgi:hypothetical protein
MAKMERQSERQASVLRRKAEEAAAANRRLKEALGRQKQAQEERLKRQETTEASGLGNRVRVRAVIFLLSAVKFPFLFRNGYPMTWMLRSV